jgi:hypothetical protein
VPIQRRWLKPKEVAKILDCHLQSIYSGLLSGDLPGAKIKGVGWRVDIKAINEMMERQIAERRQK